MGMVVVRVYGSFKQHEDRVFCAEEGGHAHAIARGIKLLADLLPGAIKLDHELQSQGMKPKAPWGEE